MSIKHPTPPPSQIQWIIDIHVWLPLRKLWDTSLVLLIHLSKIFIFPFFCFSNPNLNAIKYSYQLSKVNAKKLYLVSTNRRPNICLTLNSCKDVLNASYLFEFSICLRPVLDSIRSSVQFHFCDKVYQGKHMFSIEANAEFKFSLSIFLNFRPVIVFHNLISFKNLRLHFNCLLFLFWN